MLIGLHDFGKIKKVIKNRDKSKITKYLIFPICCVKGRRFTFFFTNLINSKLISELVSSDKTVFLCSLLMKHKYDEFC